MQRTKILLRQNKGVALLLTVLCGSLGLNVFLGWRVVALGDRAQAMRRGGVQEGSFLSAIPVRATDGSQRQWITFGGSQATILYVLSPTCAWCKRNQANIVALANARRSDFRFVGISNTRAALNEYLAANPLPFPVYYIESTDLMRRLAFDFTPQTVIVNPGGRVHKVWGGAYEGVRLREIENYFGISLPGLHDDPGGI